jgi:hypothetical protein
MKDDSITVQQRDEKWKIARDKDTKVTGNLRVGARVTIQYQMKAVSIEAKEEPKAEPKKSEPEKAAEPKTKQLMVRFHPPPSSRGRRVESKFPCPW